MTGLDKHECSLFVSERLPGEGQPLTKQQRLKQKLHSTLSCCCKKDDDSLAKREEELKVQYKLESTSPGPSFSSVELSFKSFFTWIFDSSFCAVFALIFLSSIIFTLLFAIILLISTLDHPDCIGGLKLDPNKVPSFYLCYSLSWTTFTSVGYGHVYPAHSETHPTCPFVEGICVVEAFFGLLYTALCGSILVTKIFKSQHQADVVFCDPLCIRFDHAISQVKEGKAGYPILEFRVTNSRANETKNTGALINSEINCIITNDPCEFTSSSSMRFSMESFEVKRKESSFEMRQRRVEHLQLVQYENSEELHVEKKEHPYFQRVWWIRHKLDENSALLKPSMREKLLLSAGRGWQLEELNCDFIRQNMREFGNIVITLTGMSSSTTNIVYAQKSYSPSNIVVGYKLAEIMSYDVETGQVFIDFELVNDVNEQDGGGGELLENTASLHSRLILHELSSTKVISKE